MSLPSDKTGHDDFTITVFITMIIITLFAVAMCSTAQAAECLSQHAARNGNPDTHLSWSGRVERHRGAHCWSADEDITPVRKRREVVHHQSGNRLSIQRETRPRPAIVAPTGADYVVKFTDAVAAAAHSTAPPPGYAEEERLTLQARTDAEHLLGMAMKDRWVSDALLREFEAWLDARAARAAGVRP